MRAPSLLTLVNSVAMIVRLLARRDRNLYGGESIAVSGTETARVWVALGAYMEHDEAAAAIFESVDGGLKWRRLSPPTWPVRGSANNVSTRALGERLVAHPVTNDVLLYSSYSDGLWRCADPSANTPTWTLVPCGGSGGLPCDAVGGAQALMFDPSSPNGDTV
jgi:hypothetical protein